ncbi:hypothetical protein FACS1894152_4200 [Bacilli bacterium]|nr:hypothetical protein FACS1894152_4200 [Bacilli bacterium]
MPVVYTYQHCQNIIERKTQQFKDIYGSDINVEQNSPDGQFINIEAQAEADLSECLVGIYNSFDPDSAVGRELDRCDTYKGLKRKGATYTQLMVTITTDRACAIKAGFLIGDDIGNNFSLMEDFSCPSAGTYMAIFQSMTLGKVVVGLNTVTNIVTPVLGITSVINNSAPLQAGVDEESDFDMRTRFNKSVALNGAGNIDNLYSRLTNLPDVISCYIDNNRTGATNEYGTPGHSIWVIVNGGIDEEIAKTIYSTISDGCGMRGNIEVDLLDSQGEVQQIFFDRVTTETLYIKFTVYGKTPSVTIDTNQIKTDLINSIVITTNMVMDKNYINTILTMNNRNIIYSDIQVSKDGTNWFDMVANTNLNYQFTLSTDDIAITIV